MFIATIIVSLFLAVALTASGIGKLTRMPQVVQSLGKAGVRPEQFPILAGLEFAGAVGLVIGLWWAPLGIAAAVGVLLYFGGAVGAHLRAGDGGGSGPAGFLLVVALAALLLRIVTA